MQIFSPVNFAQNGVRAMRIARYLLTALFALALFAVPQSAMAQSALSAANSLGSLMGGAGGGISSDDMMVGLEGAAEAGQPMALWQLGEMYENGIGVEQDSVRAFNYFSQIANEHADAPPHSVEADIVARSFIKIGDYYKVGLPSAGIAADQSQAQALLFHAATYFGDADAQYRVGLLYLSEEENQQNPVLSTRWLSLAAHKGHVPAQAVLGDLMYNGHDSGPVTLSPQPIEGLMWLTLAYEGTFGSEDATWIGELLTRAMSVATPDQRIAAHNAANAVRGKLAEN